MMATTHVLTGVAIAAAAAAVSPEVSVVAVAAAAVGGLFPDLDLYAGHRKTLHYPVYFSVAAAIAVGIAALGPTTLTVAGALFLVAAAVHSVMDAFGGGLELRPWRGTSDRAVYSHFHRQWIVPRRWIRYDGSPEDLGLATMMALPALAVFEGPLTLGVVALLAISATYVLIRKPMVRLSEWLVGRLPEAALTHVPARFVEDLH
ncbi:metal-dependent hydrolase [Halanaeroarchaeum sp. HSR-CO]|uniref:metal-dependent hydrolase n=1 Tax=Halanaeroarchaeum sp. HSR-CO TaxID=2866382 RepID=UPI00217D37ED|nr:metal-dependent hydrolase [Halanaeroarchaeum sp. HSR-CO]